MLESDTAQELDHSPMKDCGTKILDDMACVRYLRTKSSEFDMSYREHYIQRRKAFTELDMTESFLLSILMYLYH